MSAVLGQKSVFHDYCRVTLHLPTHTVNEKLAAEEIIEKFKCAYNGSTYTGTNQSVFTGSWINTVQSPPTIYDDSVALLIVDMPFNVNTHRKELGTQMDLIRSFAFAAYANSGAPQEEIWLIVNPITVRLHHP